MSIYYIRRASGPWRVRSQFNSLIGVYPLLESSPRAVLGPKAGESWLSCDLVVALSWFLDGWRSILEASRTVSGTPCWLMLGICRL